MSEELKPCPCGGQVYVGELKFTGETQWCVGCLQCDRNSGKHADKASAIAARNRRASHTPELKPYNALLQEVADVIYRAGADAGLKHGPIVTRWDCPPPLFERLSSPRVEEVRREALEEAAALAEQPYSDAVAALGTDEPFAVGKKIAKAIRALSPPSNPPQEKDDE